MKKSTFYHVFFSKAYLVFLFIFCFSTIGIAQKRTQQNNNNNNKINYSKQTDSIKDTYDQEKLTALYNEFSERYARRKNEAETYALLNNIPLKKYNDDGSFDELQKLSEENIPIYYTLHNVNASISTRANYLNSGGGLGLDVNGDNLTAHVWDGGPTRPTHQEFDGSGGSNRVTINDGVTTLNGNSFHSQHVTGTIVASGFQANAKGMAWQANALTHEWNNDLAEATAEAAIGMLVSNHSYGYNASSIPDDWFGQYGSDANEWDELMYNAPYYLMMNSAGNDGGDDSSNGSPLDGNSAYDKLNGTATAKNNMVVANGLDATINGDGSLNSVSRNSGSSEGPTDDYRIKPDIMGNGTSLYSCYDGTDSEYASISGTSMSSPNVTGTLLLLQEHYDNLNGNFMKAATLKGLALHTADDVSPVGPDAQSGWGLLNAKFAAETITTAANANGSAIIDELLLSQGQTYQITVQSDGINPLMASISWTDPAGTINNGTNSNTPALVNDLDIRLDNGSSFTPWRLTGVTTNGTGDNVVDPYERIDISSASGTYTLTVSHKGTLSASQNFSLIVTGVVVATTPVISYASTSGDSFEDTNCSYTDINVPLNIGQAPSADADVDFTINVSSTATSGLDFDLMTSSLTFPTGSTNTQNMVLRVYHDGFVELGETAIIDFTVNANGGDATADTNSDSFTLTITDNDLAPIATQNINILFEDFDDATGWTAFDADGDGENWVISDLTGIHGYLGNTARSFSWNGSNFSPNNYIFSPQFTIPANAISADVTYEIGSGTDGGFFSEHYSVYFTTDISSEIAIQGGTVLENNRTIPAVGSETRNHDLSALAGQTGYFVVRHHNVTGEWYLGLDTIIIDAVVGTTVQTAVNDGVSNDSQDLASSGTIYTSDSVSGDVMLDITNNQSDDYGCLDISVSRAGTGAQSYNGSVSPSLVMDKVFKINPLNTVGSGDVNITFYFTEAEIAGWELATGFSRNSIQSGRELGGDFVEITALTIGSFGSAVTLTGSFSDLEGNFYFGESVVIALGTCGGGKKTWISGVWDGDGLPPTNTQQVVISDVYNTGLVGESIDACILDVWIGAELIVTDGYYVKVEGAVDIEASILEIKNGGSFVQVDNGANVKNSGTIMVEKITTPLTDRDFSIMGSPMSGETKEGVYTSATHVRYHDTNLFTPHPQVEIDDPGAESFADDTGDNWQAHTGALIVGEGYLVKPYAIGQTGGTYTTNYTQGTLNNGVVNFTAIFGDDQYDSPNILSNPYASSVDAFVFVTDNDIVDAIYYWEHITAPDGSYPGYNSQNYDMGDISMYNLTGGMSAANEQVGAPVAKPSNQFIPSGQGFGVKAFDAGTGSTVTFDNSMRLTGNNTNYRNSEAAIDRLYLNIANSTYGLKSGTLIGFTEGATDGYDRNYDAKRLATPVSLYSLNGDRELGIQGRSVFNEDHIIPLGFSTQVEENQEYTISISSLEGEQISQATVYLKDNLLNTLTNLSETDYTFIANAGHQTERFVIVFVEDVLGTNDLSVEAISLYPNPTQNLLNIVSPQAEITSIEVFDVRGRLISNETINYQRTHQLDMSILESAMYFVTINTEFGSITKRVVKE